MLQVDPDTYDKDEAFVDAIKHCERFLAVNLITPLSCIMNRKGKGAYGTYHSVENSIWVDVHRTIFPCSTPGYSWSYTGYKADLTAPGVLAHEVGHHVHYRALCDGNKKCDKAMSTARQLETEVSSYEPNLCEVFAEAFKLFILNPDLLLQGRPMRYAVLAGCMGLKPIVTEPWHEVLLFAHPKLLKAAVNWIRAGRFS